MTIVGLNAYKDRKREIRTEYRLCRDYCQLMLIRMKATNEILHRYDEITNKFATNKKCQCDFASALASVTKDALVCIPGFQEKPELGSQRAMLLNMLRAVDCTREEAANFVTCLHMHMLPNWQVMIDRYERIQNEVIAQVKGLRELRRKIWKDVEASESAHKKHHAQVMKAKSELQKLISKNKTKNIPAAKAKVVKYVPMYLKMSRDLQVKVGKYNEVNERYVLAMSIGAARMKEVEMERCCSMVEYMSGYVDRMIKEHGMLAECVVGVSQKYVTGEDVRTFANAHNIHRMDFKGFTNFKEVRLGFSDASIVYAMAPPLPVMEAIPVVISEAICDRMTESSVELPFQNGDLIPLFERPGPKMSICMGYVGNNKDHTGMLRCDSLVVVKGLTQGVCVCEYFPAYNTDLDVRTGEVVIVMSTKVTIDVLSGPKYIPPAEFPDVPPQAQAPSCPSVPSGVPPPPCPSVPSGVPPPPFMGMPPFMAGGFPPPPEDDMSDNSEEIAPPDFGLPPCVPAIPPPPPPVMAQAPAPVPAPARSGSVIGPRATPQRRIPRPAPERTFGIDEPELGPDGVMPGYIWCQNMRRECGTLPAHVVAICP